MPPAPIPGDRRTLRRARPMRFAMVTTFYPPRHFGGDAVYVRALARALVRAGHEVDVVCCDDAYAAAGGAPVAAAGAPDEAPGGPRVHRIANRWGFLSALWAHQSGTPGPMRAAIAAVLDRGYDVIHFHNVSLAGGPAVLGLGRARLRLLTLHDCWFVCATHVLWKDGARACGTPDCLPCVLRSRRPPQAWRWGDARDRGLARLDAVLAPSRWSASEHARRGFGRAIEVLPLYARFPAAAARSAAPARPRFLYSGRLIDAKGVRELVALFARLPQADLVLAGDGPLRAPLADAYRGCPTITFAGALDDDALAAAYASSTATVVPSLVPESFGLTAVESMAFGTPVIASDRGACAELVAETGGGIACDDLAALERAIRRIAANPALRDELGERAHRACAARYGEAGHVDAYLALVRARLDARAAGFAAAAG